jgi:hypothetical protein
LPLFPGTGPYLGSRHGNMSLAMIGPPAKDARLFLNGPMPVNNSGTLFIQGPEAIFGTLQIGQDIDEDATMPLFVSVMQTPSDPNATLFESPATIHVSGGGNEQFARGATLTILSPLIGTLSKAMALCAVTDPIPSGGIFFGSGNINVAISGGNAGNVYSSQDASTALFIETQASANSGVSLYIEKPDNANISLFIKSQDASGIGPLAIDGAYVNNSGVSLFIKSPSNGSTSIFTEGYSE